MNFSEYLEYVIKSGSEGSNREIEAISHMYGRDFEVYTTNRGTIPYLVQTTPNKLTHPKPIRLWFKEGRYNVFFSENEPTQSCAHSDLAE